VHFTEDRVVFARGTVGGSYAALLAGHPVTLQPAPTSNKAPADDEADGSVVEVSADSLATLDGLADWSAWVPFDDAVRSATRGPGVYMARNGADGPLVYMGMAGERRGRGVRGRLETYDRGKGAVSGLGEACLDRALADPSWVADRLVDRKAGMALRAKEWARLAVRRADLRMCWSETSDADTARALELSVLVRLRGMAIWNRAR
jgi:hypothetical protein